METKHTSVNGHSQFYCAKCADISTDLLAAVKLALELLEHLPDRIGGIGTKYVQERMGAAIAKAEGKAESGNAATDLLIVTVAGLSILAAVFTLGALPALIMLAEVGRMFNF